MTTESASGLKTLQALQKLGRRSKEADYAHRGPLTVEFYELVKPLASTGVDQFHKGIRRHVRSLADELGWADADFVTTLIRRLIDDGKAAKEQRGPGVFRGRTATAVAEEDVQAEAPPTRADTDTPGDAVLPKPEPLPELGSATAV